MIILVYYVCFSYIFFLARKENFDFFKTFVALLINISLVHKLLATIMVDCMVCLMSFIAGTWSRRLTKMKALSASHKKYEWRMMIGHVCHSLSQSDETHTHTLSHCKKIFCQKNVYIFLYCCCYAGPIEKVE